jgi:hypothetical protein
MNERVEAAAKDSAGLAYSASALALVWYVLKGGDDVIYLFWALIFFIHATGQRVSRSVVAALKGGHA